MKKAAITLAVLLSLSLCLMVSASAIIGGTATEVSFTQENVVGDPASAEGFSVQSLFTLKGHAHWDTTLTLGKNPTWNTDFSYSTIAKAESYSVEPYVNLYTLAGFSVSESNIKPPMQACWRRWPRKHQPVLLGTPRPFHCRKSCPIFPWH